MARGNQREKAREKNLKTQAAQKNKNAKSGYEMQRDKEAAAQKMREKQAAGKKKNNNNDTLHQCPHPITRLPTTCRQKDYMMNRMALFFFYLHTFAINDITF